MSAKGEKPRPETYFIPQSSEMVRNVYRRLHQALYRLRYEARVTNAMNSERFEILEEELAQLTRKAGQLADSLMIPFEREVPHEQG